MYGELNLIERLEAENKVLREENAVLKEKAGWFIREMIESVDLSTVGINRVKEEQDLAEAVVIG